VTACCNLQVFHFVFGSSWFCCVCVDLISNLSFFVCQNAAFLCRILPNLVKIETTIINVANSNLLLLGLIQFVKTDSKENTESNVNVEGVSNCYQQQTASESKDIQYFETDKCKRKNNQFRVCSQMCLCIRGTDMS